MILCINPGSSSLKYKLFENDLTLYKSNSFSVKKSLDFKDFKTITLNFLNELEPDIAKIESVCVRVVHGGGIFNKPTLMTQENIKKLAAIADLAPLHNPISLVVIKTLKKKLGDKKIYAIFDTAFFADLPKSAKTYAIPLDISQKFNIKRFGAHGISHNFALNKVDPQKKSKLISIHLGAGCSICAINQGKPIDISMGLTPEEGLIMQTRSGDVDPGIIFYLISKLGYKHTKEIIEQKSGLKGLTSLSGEMLDVLVAAREKISASNYEPNFKLTKELEEKAKLAIEIYVNKIKKYIGGYAAEMTGVDIIVFTGKVGFGSKVIRDKILNGLSFLGYKKNVIIEPDEELAMAGEIINFKLQIDY